MNKCGKCGKQFMSPAQLAHHGDNADRLCKTRPIKVTPQVAALPGMTPLGLPEYERANADYRGETLDDLTADLA